MSWKVHAVIIATVTTAIIVFSLLIASRGLMISIPLDTPRTLALWYLRTTYTPWNRNFSAMAPEGVTAIVWDYRGLDTVFETCVLYFAIIASVAIMRDIVIKPGSIQQRELGLSIIAKTATRLIVPLIVVTACAIALHGHLTPGGGFQGGATAAVVTLLILIVFSYIFTVERGITKNKMLVLRSVGLLGIGLVSLAALIVALIYNVPKVYILQNQPKPIAPIGLPYRIGPSLVSGTLIMFNIFETLAVVAGFTLLYLLLSYPEEEVRRYMVEEMRAGETHG